MKISSKESAVSIGESTVLMHRTEEGVIHIQGDDPISLQRGLGFAHAQDRLMQMVLTRILAEGKITQSLFDSDEAFAFDLLIRKLGFQNSVKEDLGNLTPEAKQWCGAYCEGVNSYIEKYGAPLIFKFLKLKPRPWKIEDTMLLINMHLYLGLAQLQERIERFIIQAIHDGVNVEKVRQLFSPALDQLDETTIDYIRKIHLERPYLDVQMQFEPGFSNNWAIAGWKSATGSPLTAFDPHLQVNRLPSIWYEIILQNGENFQMGITIPGFPGLVMGRNRNLSASFTYGMMDTVDFFIEEINASSSLSMRTEIFHRKKRGDVALHFFETDTGVIERGDYLSDSLEGGLYLSLAYSGRKRGASPNLNALVNLWSLDNVEEAGKCVREVTLACNWVLADRSGGIAYQQSGRLPKRSHSGLYPLVAWEKENHWKGFVESSELSCDYRPERGFVASANDNKNQEGKPLSISVPFASYRYDRICNFLSQEKQFTLEEMKHLQTDLYSIQAELFLDQLRELIPDTPVGDVLKSWDCRYTKDSKGATLFEAFYFDILQEVFGKVFGERAWNQLATRHSLLVFTHGHFDRVLLSDDERWFEKEGKKHCFRRQLEKTLGRFSVETIPSWGEKNQFTMANMLFDQKLPKFFGFDIGPLQMEGSRATIAANQIFRERTRTIVAAASYRFVSDLSKEEAYTILAGGVSENRFSKYYCREVKKWLAFEYKKLIL